MGEGSVTVLVYLQAVYCHMLCMHAIGPRAARCVLDPHVRYSFGEAINLLAASVPIATAACQDHESVSQGLSISAQLVTAALVLTTACAIHTLQRLARPIGSWPPAIVRGDCVFTQSA